MVLACPAAQGCGQLHGDLGGLHTLFIFFFSTNLLISYWEMCLFRQDEIRGRYEYWRRWRRETGRIPAVAFLGRRAPLSRALSPSLWTETWSASSWPGGEAR